MGGYLYQVNKDPWYPKNPIRLCLIPLTGRLPRDDVKCFLLRQPKVLCNLVDITSAAALERFGATEQLSQYESKVVGSR